MQLQRLQHYRHPIDLGIASVRFQRGCSLSPRNITLQSLEADSLPPLPRYAFVCLPPMI